jgi:hypothetical protein
MHIIMLIQSGSDPKMLQMEKKVKRISFGNVDITDNDLVMNNSFGSVDNHLVKLFPFGKVTTKPGKIAAFGEVVAFGKVIDKDLVTAEPLGKLDSNLVMVESFGQVDHIYETVESFGTFDSDLLTMLLKGNNVIDHDAIGNILSVLAINVGTHKVS